MPRNHRRPGQRQQRAGQPQRQELNESQTSATLTAVEGRPGRFLLELITPGRGTSAYYPAKALEGAARDRVFPAGTHMYLDHPRGDGSGVDARGNRSVADLAAVLDEDARWTGSSLVAECRVFGQHREELDEKKDDIGLSIRSASRP